MAAASAAKSAPPAPAPQSAGLAPPLGRKALALVFSLLDVLFYAGLIALLGLFVDFFANRGRVPALADIPVANQQRFLESWKNLDSDERTKQLGDLGILASLTAAETDSNAYKKRDAMLARLLGKETAPANAPEADFAAWGKRNGGLADPHWSARLENEIRWRAYVRHLLQVRVSPAAAEVAAKVVTANGETYFRTDPIDDAGYIGLLVRKSDSWAFPAFAAAGRVMPWLADASAGDLDRRYLWTLFGLGLGFAFLRFLSSLCLNRNASRATLETVTKLRRAVYHQCHTLGNVSHDSDGTSVAGPLFGKQVEAVHDDLYVQHTSQLRYWCYLVVLPLMAFLANFWLTAAILAIGMVVWLLVGARIRTLKKKAKESHRRGKAWLSRLTESLRLMRLVKSFGMEPFNQSRVERQLADYQRQQLIRHHREGSIRPTVLFFITVSMVVSLFLAGWILARGGITILALTIVVASLLSLYQPVRTLLGMRRYHRKAGHALAEIEEYLARQGRVKEIIDGEFLDTIRKQVRFEDVTLKGFDDEPVLRHLDLSIPAGHKVGIVGPDEMQKKSLFYLLLRLNDPKTGAVRMDGKDLKWVSKESLRTQVACVLQDQLVFNDTVANNIGCGEAGIGTPKIIEAAKLAHAHQFIQKLPYGYETVIGDFGHALTVGEKFRIALARCILRDPSVLLIEEPGEGLDEETKELYDDTAERFLKGRTVIYLPHRVSTLKTCDTLYLVNEGRVEAQGRHRELLHDSPLYKHLYYVEFNQFADGA